MTHINKIPQELLIEVFLLFRSSELGNLRVICKNFHKIINGKELLSRMVTYADRPIKQIIDEHHYAWIGMKAPKIIPEGCNLKPESYILFKSEKPVEKEDYFKDIFKTLEKDVFKAPLIPFCESYRGLRHLDTTDSLNSIEITNCLTQGLSTTHTPFEILLEYKDLLPKFAKNVINLRLTWQGIFKLIKYDLVDCILSTTKPLHMHNLDLRGLENLTYKDLMDIERLCKNTPLSSNELVMHTYLRCKEKYADLNNTPNLIRDAVTLFFLSSLENKNIHTALEQIASLYKQLSPQQKNIFNLFSMFRIPIFDIKSLEDLLSEENIVLFDQILPNLVKADVIKLLKNEIIYQKHSSFIEAILNIIYILTYHGLGNSKTPTALKEIIRTVYEAFQTPSFEKSLSNSPCLTPILIALCFEHASNIIELRKNNYSSNSLTFLPDQTKKILNDLEQFISDPNKTQLLEKWCKQEYFVPKVILMQSSLLSPSQIETYAFDGVNLTEIASLYVNGTISTMEQIKTTVLECSDTSSFQSET